MGTLTLSDILDDLQNADRVLRRFEQRYWISTGQFYDLYSQGQLDNGDHAEEFAEWAGYYKLKLKRERALEELSRQRVTQLRSQASGDILQLAPVEPVLQIG
ncbi:hypothetical protein KFU94_05265 [Chloroflexi bacterium TSY]|nr:hypothetical protein [Chloroflexi bacterium TSY]